MNKRNCAKKAATSHNFISINHLFISIPIHVQLHINFISINHLFINITYPHFRSRSSPLSRQCNAFVLFFFFFCYCFFSLFLQATTKEFVPSPASPWWLTVPSSSHSTNANTWEKTRGQWHWLSLPVSIDSSAVFKGGTERKGTTGPIIIIMNT